MERTDKDSAFYYGTYTNEFTMIMMITIHDVSSSEHALVVVLNAGFRFLLPTAKGVERCNG